MKGTKAARCTIYQTTNKILSNQYKNLSKRSFSCDNHKGRLDGKVAFITGAGSGIGRQASLLFAENGGKVLCTDINEETSNETAKMVNDQFGNNSAISQKVDVANAESVKQAIAKAETEFGLLNVLYNNAGIMHPEDDNEETTEENIFDLTYNINVKGVFNGCKYGVPALRRAGGGSVINVASFVAIVGSATPQIAYTASKGAVLSMTRELAILHAKDNIRFNSLCPGALRTELLMSFLNTEEKKHRRLVHIPMGRFGEAKEMAQAVIFLASDESSYMTGSELVVDGGLTNAYVTPE